METPYGRQVTSITDILRIRRRRNLIAIKGWRLKRHASARSCARHSGHDVHHSWLQLAARDDLKERALVRRAFSRRLPVSKTRGEFVLRRNTNATCCSHQLSTRTPSVKRLGIVMFSPTAWLIFVRQRTYVFDLNQRS
jgi:hypothetical protein